MLRFTKAKVSIEQKIDEKITLHHQSMSQNKIWANVNQQSVQSKKRKVYVANFRKMTGHDLLYKHLERIGVVPSPTCIFCHGEEQTSDHILQCPQLEDVKKKIQENATEEEELFSELYWHVRERQ